MNEVWKAVKGYEGLYEISNTGKVKSLIKERLLKPWEHKKGYLVVKLTKDKSHKEFKIHRLVAQAFIPNIDNKEQVNHIDGNKHNNYVENLEWCNDAENRMHAYKNGLRKMEELIEVEMVSIDGNFIDKFPSISEASRRTGINIGNISRCCNGGCKTAGGYIFKRSEVLNDSRLHYF